MSENGNRWVVSAYGVVGWVLNARVTKQVTLSRGGQSERVTLVELDPAKSVPVLRKYMLEVPITRQYFDAAPDSTDEVIRREVVRHPVFAVSPVTAQT